MNGPLNVTTITAATKFPEPMRFDVTITLPLEIWNCDYDYSNLEKFLGYHFHDYEDGRYPFDTELAKYALSMCLKNVVAQCVREGEYEKYRGEYIKHPNGKTAKGCVTAEEILKKLYVCIGEKIKFAVKPTEKKDDER